MVAVAIIAVLAGLALYGMRHIGSSTAGQTTKVALENLRAMLGELETQTKLSRSPGAWSWQDGPVINAGGNFNFWRSPGPAPYADLDAPGVVTDNNDPTANASRNGARAILNTALAMQQMAGVSSTRNALQALRPESRFIPEWSDKMYPGPGDDHVMKTTDDAPEAVVYVVGNRVTHLGKSYVCIESEPTGTPATNGSAWKEDPAPIPMLRDGWDNPIIFVPASGLRVRLLLDKNENDWSDATQTRIITSGGDLKVTIPPQPPQPLPAGAKPFFASAGPDGDFSTGDDNVYSFGN